MKKLKNMSTGESLEQFLRPGKVESAEKAALEMFNELQTLALKDGGMLAVAGVGIAAGEQIKEIMAVCASREMDEQLTRAIVADFLLTSWLPPAIEHMQDKLAAAATNVD